MCDKDKLCMIPVLLTHATDTLDTLEMPGTCGFGYCCWPKPCSSHLHSLTITRTHSAVNRSYTIKEISASGRRRLLQ